MNTEIWREIEGYDAYQVSSTGKVRSIYFLTRNNRKVLRVKELKLTISRYGYHFVGIIINKKQKKYIVHRLVAKAFIPNPLTKAQVNHINGIKTDNRVENLEWVTPQENVQKAWDTGLNEKVRVNSGFKSIPYNVVKEIREKYIPHKMSLPMLADYYNISITSVFNIVKNKLHKNI